MNKDEKVIEINLAIIKENLKDFRSWNWIIIIILSFISLALPVFTFSAAGAITYRTNLYWFQAEQILFASGIPILSGLGAMLIIGIILCFVVFILGMLEIKYKNKILPLLGITIGILILIVPVIVYFAYGGMTIDAFMTSIWNMWGGGLTGSALFGTTTIGIAPNTVTYTWSMSFVHVIDLISAGLLFFNSFLYWKDIKIQLKKD
ncbi:MAG: hypothetical protein EAX96_06295 [Candidatus Lokiarchaeota archaeon]|nr:hypothetical protein [Candidatus Lokiarchaeota archaeon]